MSLTHPHPPLTPLHHARTSIASHLLLPASPQQATSDLNAAMAQDTALRARGVVPKKRRKKWTAEDDALLRLLYAKHGAQWSMVSSFVPGRAAENGGQKRCRERWINHLDPRIKKTPWTATEDAKLTKLFNKFGSMWNLLAKSFEGRSEIQIKNRCNTMMRRSGELGAQNRTKGGKGSRRRVPRRAPSASGRAAVAALAAAGGDGGGSAKRSRRSSSASASSRSRSRSRSRSSVDASGALWHEETPHDLLGALDEDAEDAAFAVAAAAAAAAAHFPLLPRLGSAGVVLTPAQRASAAEAAEARAAKYAAALARAAARARHAVRVAKAEGTAEAARQSSCSSGSDTGDEGETGSAAASRARATAKAMDAAIAGALMLLVSGE